MAFQRLARAEHVIFIGYSFPITDIAASFLFREALGHLTPSQIQIVNFATSDEGKRAVVSAYREVFPELPDEQFDFRGALEWSCELACAQASEYHAEGAGNESGKRD